MNNMNSLGPPATWLKESSTVGSLVYVDLSAMSSAGEICAGEAACLVVLWWNDYPVGQVADVGAPGRVLDRTRLRAAVAPDVLQHAKSIVASETALGEPPAVEATVVICTRDRPEALARCLASLPQQTLPPVQIIVVDNASADERTREAAVAAGVEYVREDRPGLAFARNAGARAARGEIIAYTDDDVQLHPRWLERLVRAFDASEVMAVTGLVLPAELETEAQRHFETYWSFGRGYRRIDFGPRFFAADRTHGCPVWEVGAGASMAFRRQVFATVGLFDERLGAGASGCSEDSEYWHRVLTHGGICRYDPGAVVYHYHRRDFAGLSNQIFHYMRGHAAALLVQFERSGNVGNLRRALISMPVWYARRALRCALKGASEPDRFLLAREIAGYFSGIAFYLRQPRPGSRREPV